MNSLQESFILHNGIKIPCVGFGTYLSAAGGETERAVAEALKVGYRHIDTAAFYKNESDVGNAVKKSGIAREEIFVTTKCWNADRGYENAKAACEKSLLTLGLSYIDLYLIHWPANEKQFGERAEEINAETWRAFEELCAEGKIRAAGVSNFLPHHLETLKKTAKFMPAVDQIEARPGFWQEETLDYCRAHSILVEAWSPLGRGASLALPAIGTLAEKYGKSPAQIILRRMLQRGILPLPKSVTPARIAENADLFDFTLSDADCAAIDALRAPAGKNPDEIDF